MLTEFTLKVKSFQIYNKINATVICKQHNIKDNVRVLIPEMHSS